MTIAQLFAQHNNGRGYADVKVARRTIYGDWIWAIERNLSGTHTVYTPRTTYHNVSGDIVTGALT
jgi:hypothetical protein